MEGKESVNLLAPPGLGRMIFVQMAVRAAIELKVFDIIARSDLKPQLSSAEILSKIPTENPNALVPLERILRMLGAHSILSMSTRQDGVTYYGLTSESSLLVPGENGFSLSPLVMYTSEKAMVDCLYTLKDAVLKQECMPLFETCHGATYFDYIAKKPELRRAFNQALMTHADFFIDMMLETYDGFEGVSELMDVGGNLGGIMQKIVSKYPHIRGINFDMPHVIANAPTIQGVENIGGDMFESLPKAETIFMKFILHDWNDEKCIQILKNCWSSLPKNGKVIAGENVIPEILESDNEETAIVITIDFMMMFQHDGKERTFAEFDALAKAAGFVETKLFDVALGCHVLEFIK